LCSRFIYYRRSIYCRCCPKIPKIKMRRAIPSRAKPGKPVRRPHSEKEVLKTNSKTTSTTRVVEVMPSKPYTQVHDIDHETTLPVVKATPSRELVVTADPLRPPLTPSSLKRLKVTEECDALLEAAAEQRIARAAGTQQSPAGQSAEKGKRRLSREMFRRSSKEHREMFRRSSKEHFSREMFRRSSKEAAPSSAAGRIRRLSKELSRPISNSQKNRDREDVEARKAERLRVIDAKLQEASAKTVSDLQESKKQSKSKSTISPSQPSPSKRFSWKAAAERVAAESAAAKRAGVEKL